MWATNSWWWVFFKHRICCPWHRTERLCHRKLALFFFPALKHFRFQMLCSLSGFPAAKPDCIPSSDKLQVVC
jgi:hypothetical protein